mmetsp:Transcript_23657/g.23366  ORF Transcript_23657/g.23366 Transcript_23657/m.23366 type:complete len:312 (+) Transcript_23657:477-1412(+)
MVGELVTHNDQIMLLVALLEERHLAGPFWDWALVEGGALPHLHLAMEAFPEAVRAPLLVHAPPVHFLHLCQRPLNGLILQLRPFPFQHTLMLLTEGLPNVLDVVLLVYHRVHSVRCQHLQLLPLALRVTHLLALLHQLLHPILRIDDALLLVLDAGNHVLDGQLQTLDPLMVVRFVLEAVIDDVFDPVLLFFGLFVALDGIVELLLDGVESLLEGLRLLVVRIESHNTARHALQDLLLLLDFKHNSVVLIDQVFVLLDAVVELFVLIAADLLADQPHPILRLYLALQVRQLKILLNPSDPRLHILRLVGCG